MKNKVLFITEKWCDGIPQRGLTNNYHNLFGTFKNSYPDSNFNILHLDECAHLLKTHIDNVLPEVYKKVKPDIVIFSLLGKSDLNPTKYSYNFLKDKNVKMIFMWPDIGIDWGKPQIENELKTFADLHVSWGAENNLKEDKLLSLWAPQDEKLYFPVEECEKTIDCSFIGSTRYEERERYLKYLVNNKVNVHIDGGQREKKLTPKQYASLIQKTKININFPFSPSGFDQCKGRVWEILATGGFLLERKNLATKNFLTPQHDYVEYSDENDLKEKINYYLKNEEERIKIQQNGFKTYKLKYSSKIFWDLILKRYENE